MWAASAAGTERGSPTPRGRPGASARDLGLLGKAIPHRLPGRHPEAELLAQSLHLDCELLPDLVVVAELEPILPVQRVLGRARAAEDVHGADVPLGERRLGLVVSGRVLGQT